MSDTKKTQPTIEDCKEIGIGNAINPLTDSQVKELLLFPFECNDKAVRFMVDGQNIGLFSLTPLPNGTNAINEIRYWDRSRQWVSRALELLAENNPGRKFKAV